MFGNDYNHAAAEARTTTTLKSWQTKLSVVTPALTGTYIVFWTAILDALANDRVEARLQNVTDAATLDGPASFESVDIADLISVGGQQELVFAGAPKQLEVQFQGAGGGPTTVGIQQARVTYWRVA